MDTVEGLTVSGVIVGWEDDNDVVDCAWSGYGWSEDEDACAGFGDCCLVEEKYEPCDDDRGVDEACGDPDGGVPELDREPGEGWLECDDECGMGMGAEELWGSCSCIRRSICTVALLTATLASTGWRCRGIERVSDGPTG